MENSQRRELEERLDVPLPKLVKIDMRGLPGSSKLRNAIPGPWRPTTPEREDRIRIISDDLISNRSGAVSVACPFGLVNLRVFEVGSLLGFAFRDRVHPRRPSGHDDGAGR